MITYDTAGSDIIPHVKEKPEFLMVSNMSRYKIALLLRKRNPKCSLSESKRGSGHYAMKHDEGGIQHTPGI
jgi:hypothetical protein